MDITQEQNTSLATGLSVNGEIWQAGNHLSVNAYRAPNPGRAGERRQPLWGIEEGRGKRISSPYDNDSMEHVRMTRSISLKRRLWRRRVKTRGLRNKYWRLLRHCVNKLNMCSPQSAAGRRSSFQHPQIFITAAVMFEFCLEPPISRHSRNEYLCSCSQ